MELFQRKESIGVALLIVITLVILIELPSSGIYSSSKVQNSSGSFSSISSTNHQMETSSTKVHSAGSSFQTTSSSSNSESDQSSSFLSSFPFTMTKERYYQYQREAIIILIGPFQNDIDDTTKILFPSLCDNWKFIETPLPRVIVLGERLKKGMKDQLDSKFTNLCHSKILQNYSLEHIDVSSYFVPTSDQYKLSTKANNSCSKSFPIGYKLMCRFWMIDIFLLPELRDLEYYWRLDTDSKITGAIITNPFNTMRKKSLKYGWRIVQTDQPKCTEGFSSTIDQWIETQESSLISISSEAFDTYYNGALHFFNGNLTSIDYNDNLYNSNFEVVEMNFFRTPHYLSYAFWIDHSGGIFTTRWGDHIIHTVYVQLFTNFKERECIPIPYFHAIKVPDCPAIITRN